MRIGIAFEGCAGRAAFHVGVVEWMLENGHQPEAVAGASSGSIVAAALAAGRGEELAAVWMAACSRRLFDLRRMLKGRWPFAMSDIVGDALRAHLGDMRLADCPTPVAIPVTTIDRRGRTRRMLTRADSCSLVDAVLASCFAPGPYSRMVRIDGALTFDGAWQVRTPLDGLAGHELDREIACVTNVEGALKLGFPTTGTMQPGKQCCILAPVEELQLRSYELDPARMRRALDVGRRSARRFFENGDGRFGFRDL